MSKLRYYCQGEGKEEIRKLLTECQQKHNILYEILDLSRNGARDEKREREVYERDFKPRAKVLKKTTGESIIRLRSRRARHYFVSIPGTIATVADGKIEWYTQGDEEMAQFLKAVFDKGHSLFQQYCKGNGPCLVA